MTQRRTKRTFVADGHIRHAYSPLVESAGSIRPAWAPEGIDITRPSAARVYDYYLGGFHNFAADRRMAEQAMSMWPDLPVLMRANRAFLRRAVRALTAAGVRQFLDLGSGIPTAGNVHVIAHEAAPDSRVVYVDNDPVAVAHSRAILDGDRRTTVLQADLRRPAEVLAEAELLGVLDLARPVGLLMLAVLHFVSDEDDPAGIVAGYRDEVAAGSHLVVSHASSDQLPAELLASHRELYRRTPTPMTMRSRPEVAAFFDGLELVEPGLVQMPLWRPDGPDDVDDHPERFNAWVGVGVK